MGETKLLRKLDLRVSFSFSILTLRCSCSTETLFAGQLRHANLKTS
jgi:hypothetical protein